MVAIRGVDFDDLLYASLLVLSISFGWCFRRIKNPEKKKWVSTILGFSLVFAVSGSHILRPVAVTTINAFLITFCGKKYCHIISFIFTFGVLTFFRVSDYFGVPYAPGPVNLLNMVLTMRMIGLAFESRDSWLGHKVESKMATSGASLSEMEEKEPMDVHPSFMDVFHYSFCYVGVLTGPYFRFNTYRDMVNTPFCKYAPCWEATLKRFKILPITMLTYAFVNFFFPNKLAFQDEFYTNYSVLYRIIFLSISFFSFRMRMYTGLMLSECVCTMAGLGAYPEWCRPRSGMGPSCRWQEVARLGRSQFLAMKEKYNFETIHNINIYNCEIVPTVRVSMKNWNMSVQYWLATYVYRRFPIKSVRKKECDRGPQSLFARSLLLPFAILYFRTFATMFVSALWHGAQPGYYLCIMTVPFHLLVEDLYVQLFCNDSIGLKLRRFVNFMLWFMRFQGFSYMCITFHLLSVNASIRYWSSIYYIYHWVLFALFIFVLAVHLRRRKTRKATKVPEHDMIRSAFCAVDPGFKRKEE